MRNLVNTDMVVSVYLQYRPKSVNIDVRHQKILCLTPSTKQRQCLIGHRRSERRPCKMSGKRHNSARPNFDSCDNSRCVFKIMTVRHNVGQVSNDNSHALASAVPAFICSDVALVTCHIRADCHQNAYRVYI